MRLGLAAGLLLLASGPVFARNVDTSDAPSFVDDGRLFRVGYANDFFTGTDRYYTQGVSFELFDPAFRGSPLMRLLFGLPSAKPAYGLQFRIVTFTPTRLDSAPAIIGDRPFAAYAFLGHSLVTRDDERGLLVVTEVDGGIIGAAADGKAQRWAHRVLKQREPDGWDNQIRSDVVADYYARVEKVVQATRVEDVAVYGDATAGTLYDNAAAGVIFRAGKRAGALRGFVFGTAEEKAVGWDATLEGGAFNHHSPYTIRPADLERRVSRQTIGAALEFRGWVFRAERVFLSREFREGLSHQWMELTILKRL